LYDIITICSMKIDAVLDFLLKPQVDQEPSLKLLLMNLRW
jgi:hypothetical protein